MGNDTFTPLARSFYEDISTLVAQKLLSKVLARKYEGAWLAGIIVETEAYLAQNDPAADNFIGKTDRNAVLFGEAGHAYVHSMRQYYLIDIVTEGLDQPGSVLIRALEPLCGIAGMEAARKTEDIFKLASGPGRLCQALHIERSLNGWDMTDPESSLIVADTPAIIDQKSIHISTRIGISKATDALLRFYIKGSPYVSMPARKMG